jgi:phage shock protein A
MNIFQSVTKIVQDAGGAIGSAASQAGQAVVETAVGVSETIGSAASQAGQAVVETAVGVSETIGSAASQAGQAVVETAVGIGMAPVAAASAVVGLGAYGLNPLLEQGTDEEKRLDRALAEMQEALLRLRLAVVRAIASQKRTQQQYAQAQAEVDKWQQHIQLALQKGDENLARQALVCKKSKAETAKALKAQLEQQESQVNTLKRNLAAMESKVSEATAKRDMLKERLAAAKANEDLQNSNSSAIAAFEQMEDKVLEMEAYSQAIAELGGTDLEAQFAALEPGSNIDDELAAMKAQILTNSVSEQKQESFSPSGSAVDDELEALHKQIDNL